MKFSVIILSSLAAVYSTDTYLSKKIDVSNYVAKDKDLASKLEIVEIPDDLFDSLSNVLMIKDLKSMAEKAENDIVTAGNKYGHFRTEIAFFQSGVFKSLFEQMEYILKVVSNKNGVLKRVLNGIEEIWTLSASGKEDDMSYSRKTQIYEYFNSMGRNNEEFRRLLLGPMKDLEDQLCPIKQTVERMKQTLKTTKDEILWKNIHRMFTYNHRKLSVTHLYHSSTSVQLLILSALVFLENWYAVHEHSEFLVNDNWGNKQRINRMGKALTKGGFQELQQLEDVVVKIEKMKQDIQQLIGGMIKYIDNVMKAISWSKKTGVNVKEPEEQFVNVSISYHLIDQLKKIVKN